MSNYQTATIKQIKQQNYFTKTFILDTDIKAKPGQFVMVWLPRINEKPFSLANNKPMSLTIAKVGPFTKRLHQLKAGNKLTFRGPFGKPFKTCPSGKILIVAGGYGIVPLYWLVKQAKNKLRVTVILGAKTKKDLILTKNFKKLGVNLQICTDDGSCGFKGFTTDLTTKLLAKNKFNQIYTCGPKVMMDKLALLANNYKISCQLSLENYMKCAVGLCGQCSCGSFRVCKDGPVIDAVKYIKINDKLKT